MLFPFKFSIQACTGASLFCKGPGTSVLILHSLRMDSLGLTHCPIAFLARGTYSQHFVICDSSWSMSSSLDDDNARLRTSPSFSSDSSAIILCCSCVHPVHASWGLCSVHSSSADIWSSLLLSLLSGASQLEEKWLKNTLPSRICTSWETCFHFHWMFALMKWALM